MPVAVMVSSDSEAEEEPSVKQDSQQDSQTVSRRVQQHLQDVWAVLLSWWYYIASQDFLHACFTSVVILPDPVLTTITSNCNLTSLDHLQCSLPTLWAFAERYGNEVLALVKTIDKEERFQKEAKKRADQELRALEAQCKALGKAVEVEKMWRSRCLHHAKENCVISGTGW